MNDMTTSLEICTHFTSTCFFLTLWDSDFTGTKHFAGSGYILYIFKEKPRKDLYNFWNGVAVNVTS
jgi:hypothetical protein